MKSAILFTIITVLNLIGYTVGVSILPSSVAVHFTLSGVVDQMASPWVSTALPAAAVICSVALWVYYARAQKPNRAVSMILIPIGILFLYLGWLFFVLAAEGLELGEKISVPLGVLLIFPMSAVITVAGNYLPRMERNSFFGIRTPSAMKSELVFKKANRLCGILFFWGGIFCAVCSVLFSCLKIDYVAIIIFAAYLVASGIAGTVYAHVLYRKEKNSNAVENTVENTENGEEKNER